MMTYKLVIYDPYNIYETVASYTASSPFPAIGKGDLLYPMPQILSFEKYSALEVLNVRHWFSESDGSLECATWVNTREVIPFANGTVQVLGPSPADDGESESLGNPR